MKIRNINADQNFDLTFREWRKEYLEKDRHKFFEIVDYKNVVELHVIDKETGELKFNQLLDEVEAKNNVRVDSKNQYIKPLAFAEYDEKLHYHKPIGEKTPLTILVDLSGWDRINRSVKEIKIRLKSAQNEEQFQIIGLLCRETIISLGQTIYNIEKHPSIDGVIPSKTDAKRMLEAYIAVELSGKSNENLRKYARSTFDLANELTHKRTATELDAFLGASSTIALINFIGILEKRH